MAYPQRLSSIGDGTRLLSSPQLKRAQELLHDLIIMAYERSTKRPGKSLSLVRLQFAYDESSGEKSCMHYDILVKDHDQNELIPLHLTIGVNDFDDFGGNF